MVHRYRIVIGKHKGVKVRVRYPSMLSGYITHTYNSISEAKRDIAGLNPNQRRRTKITRV